MNRGRLLLAASTAVAAVATAGSLYFSVGLGLVPCELCWYQRVFMYPLVVVLGVAALDGDEDAWRTGLALAVPGGLVAAYHTYLQVGAAGSACSIGGGCAAVLYPMAGGLLTIPRLSLVAFALVALGLAGLAASRSDRRRG
ncbi:disulfide bond formation protein B [Halegenticoccus soli]|uniref:disulfide bond formation protein B n=1 Tax=Halegenticoccus soli TaxID=1985678 RepID=UPI000C6E263C|nr:disulfide bond formation protein B [Halegenticoccus soli]